MNQPCTVAIVSGEGEPHSSTSWGQLSYRFRPVGTGQVSALFTTCMCQQKTDKQCKCLCLMQLVRADTRLHHPCNQVLLLPVLPILHQPPLPTPGLFGLWVSMLSIFEKNTLSCPKPVCFCCTPLNIFPVHTLVPAPEWVGEPST